MRRSTASAAASQRARQLDRLLGVDGPGVEQVEVARRRAPRGEVGLVGQAGGRVLGGEARDVVGARARSARAPPREKSEVLALPRRWPT